MNAEEPIHESIDWRRESWLGIAATLLAVLTLLAIGALLGLSVHLNRVNLGALALWGSIPVSGVGLLLAVLGLMQRGKNHRLAHYGIWLNAAIAVFAAPAAMAWSLAR
jgi:hypothetical protein